MQDKDQKLIWENYLNEGTDGSTSDLTEREKMKLAAHAAKKGKGPLVVKKENRADRIHNPDPEDFRMTEDDWAKAEQEFGGLRLSKFVQQHDVDAEQPVAVHATHVQKHYGKIHASQKGAVTGSSVADAIGGFGGGSLKRELDAEQRMSKGLIITKVETGDAAQAELDKKARMNASMSNWYKDLDRGRTNYRGD